MYLCSIVTVWILISPRTIAILVKNAIQEGRGISKKKCCLYIKTNELRVLLSYCSIHSAKQVLIKAELSVSNRFKAEPIPLNRF